MYRSIRTTSIFLLIPFLITAAALGQFTSTGEIVGRVTTPDGQGAAGAEVTLSSPSRVTPARAIADRDGMYRLLNITPGTYALTVQASGYHTVRTADVEVKHGSTLKIDVDLRPMASVSDEITVQEALPRIETVKSEVNKYISKEEIQNLPLQNRNFLDVLLTVPGVQAGVPSGSLNTRGPKNSVNIHGARSNQNTFLIDGALNNDRSDLNYEDVASVQVLAGPRASTGAGNAGATFQVGTALQAFNIDAIEQVQINTALFSAEYGSGSGGIINVVTRTGTDVMEGSVTAQYQSHDYVENPPQEFDRTQGSLGLGGPIVRGRTHFFATYERDDHELGYDFNQSRFIVGPFLRDLGLTANSTQRNRMTAKISHDFAVSNTFSLSANYIDETADLLNSIFRASLDNMVPEYHENVSLGLIARDVHLFGDKMALESIVNFTTVERNFDSGNDEPRRSFVRTDPVLGTIFDFTGTNSPDSENQITNFAINEKLNWFSGRRSWKFGAGYDQFKQESYQVPYLSISHNAQGNPTSALHIPETSLSPSVTEVYAFAQQDWFQSDRTTWNLGLRVMSDDQVGETTVEPRIGVAYDLNGDGRSMLRAGVGLYHDRTNLIGATGADRPPVIIGPYDPATGTVPLTSPPNAVVIDPDLTLPTIYKWVIGYERQLPFDFVGGIHVFGSHNRDLFYTDQLNRRRNTAAGERPDPTRGEINFYTNSGESDVYDIELELRRHFRKGAVLQFSYAYQDAQGNSAFDYVSGNSPLNFVTASEAGPQRYEVVGPLDYEVRHSLKLSGFATLPWDIRFSTIANWRTGLPFTVRDTFRDPQPGGSMFEGYNSRRLDNWYNVDTRLSKAFDLGGPHSIEAFFDLFNVTNRQNVLERDGTRRFNNRGGLDDPGVTDNANYLVVRTRSAARSGQLGFRWRF
jgi:outer membrane receptor for ferrienterochelin and colicin